MKVLIFPEGYDPMVASGPPNKDVETMGITWTKEDTQKCRLLEAQTEIVEVLVNEQGKPITLVNRWYRPL